jgi:hypothetical protein
MVSQDEISLLRCFDDTPRRVVDKGVKKSFRETFHGCERTAAGKSAPLRAFFKTIPGM